MTNTTPPLDPSLPKFTIPKGWSALYEPNTKKVHVLREFVHGGMAASLLTLVTKDTQAELMAEIDRLGLTWTPPVTPVAPVAPEAQQ
jgi:hypothetical protein